MTTELKEAIKKLKFLSEQIKGSPMKEAIDTVVTELEKPLPSDEIIKVKARTYAENNTDVNAGYILNSYLAFMACAKWMRDLI